MLGNRDEMRKFFINLGLLLLLGSIVVGTISNRNLAVGMAVVGMGFYVGGVWPELKGMKL